MLQILHKILALILAFVVLLSTLSFSVEKHICMGEVTDVSIFTLPESCEMTTVEKKCNTHDLTSSQMKKQNCCDNINELVPGNQTEQQAIQKFEIEQVEFVLAYIFSLPNLFEEESNSIAFKEYPPPLVNKDINVLYQSFLI